MTTLYSLRTDGPAFRITKFVDGEPQGSYITSERECECPAGPRPTCRHRQMLPQMLAHGIANTHWFMDWDRSGSIVDFNGASKRLYDELAHAEATDLALIAEGFKSTCDIIDLTGADPSTRGMSAMAVGEAQHVEEDTSIPIPLKQTETTTIHYVTKHPLPLVSWRRL